MLRRRLLSAVLVVLASASAALTMPSTPYEHVPSDPINLTNSSLNAPPGHLQNLTYAPWPAQPYEIQLHPRFGFPNLLILQAREFHGTRPVSVPSLQGFLQEFCDNIEQEYPVPSFVPRKAQQHTIDIQSYTAWSIEFSEGILGHRMRTDVALVALHELARQLGSHGPSTILFSVRERVVAISYGYLDIKEFGAVSVNGSLAKGNSIFQTS